MSLLIFGQSGQVATELCRQAPGATFLSRTDADLSDPNACNAAIHAARPGAVINAAAYTAVDRAEEEEPLALTVNGDAPAAMAKACAALGVPLVHISTDYVFAGTGTRPWHPLDPGAPANAYGRTKLAGEEGIRAANGMHGILRTSWVFSAHGANFVKTMLRLGAQRDKLTVIADQVGGPTPARAIATACLDMAEQLGKDPAKTGTYHFSGTPDESWAGFAREIFAQAELPCIVEDIPTTSYPTPACRPLNSRLDCTETETVFGLERPDWRAGLTDVLNELGTLS